MNPTMPPLADLGETRTLMDENSCAFNSPVSPFGFCCGPGSYCPPDPCHVDPSCRRPDRCLFFGLCCDHAWCCVPWPAPMAAFRRARSRLREKAVAQATFPDPLCVVGDMTDAETLAAWTIEQRHLLRELLDAAAERVLEALRYCLDAGVGPIYYFNGPEYALPPLMSPADFEEFVVGYDSRPMRLIHSYPGTYVIVHSHGRVDKFLERFAAIGMDGLNVLEPPPMGDTVLTEAKRRVGERLCLIGNVQYDDVARKSKDHVARLVREAIRQGAPGGGFILSLCASPYERPLPKKASDNLIHYLVKGRQYGKYPVSP